MKLLQIDFTYPGPWGSEMAQAMDGLARSIAEENGVLWKIWTENEAAGEAGGIYLFEDQASASAYLNMHAKRVAEAGCTAIRGKIFDINIPLSMLDRAPL